MIFEINAVAVRSDGAAQFEAAFARVALLLAEVSGCRSARLLRCLERPGHYQVQVEWERLEDHEVIYPATQQSVEIRKLLQPLIGSAERGHFEPVSLG